MKNNHKDRKDVTITTGPVYVSPFSVAYLPNNKLVVTLKNPTHKKLQAQVTLGLCPTPNPPQACTSDSVQTFEVNETETNLGFFKVDPMTCLRIERMFNNYELFDSVIRLTATGDFKICEDSCEPICGLLEISSVVGFQEWGGSGVPSAFAEKTALYPGYYPTTGVLVTDPATVVHYGDWVFCEDHCPCDSDSSSSSSSSSSDDHH
ncbi:hypothetical protein MHH52_07335 [Paenibacillus sp. FSL K6-0276]|uniref:hypothetical protein n=1 Tax=Paenibacillus sp. FSL K6-0276 TaxID=2921450 RepID=UPI0030EB679E